MAQEGTHQSQGSVWMGRFRRHSKEIAALLIGMLLGLPALGQGTPPDAERLFSTAAAAQARGDLPAAIRAYEELLRRNPNLPDARVNLGAALAQAGRLDEAIAQYRRALTAMPDNLQVRRNLGLAFYKKGDLPDAAREFTAVRGAEPNDVSLAILLADCDVRSGQASQALAMLLPMESQNAANPDFGFVLGTALIASGQRREGATRLDALARATDSADAYYFAGSTWLDVNEGELARKDLEQAARLNPNLPHIYTLLGTACDHSADRTAAEANFREAVKREPKDFTANLSLGALLYKRRALDEAKPYLERALGMQPNSELARYEMAIWKSTSGEYAEAATDLEAVVKGNPDWLDPHVELATVYYKLHRPEDGARQRAIVEKITEEQQKRGPGK